MEFDWAPVAFLVAIGGCLGAVWCAAAAGLLMRLQVASLVFSILTVGTLWIVINKLLHPPDDPGADSAAVASLRSIFTAEMTYADTKATYGSIDDLIRAGLLSTRFLRTNSYGYNYSVVAGEETFTVTAIPATKRRSWHTGCWDYFEKSDGVVHYSNDKTRSPSGKSGAPAG